MPSVAAMSRLDPDRDQAGGPFEVRQIEQALRHARIPYSVRGSVGFYDRAVVRDALAVAVVFVFVFVFVFGAVSPGQVRRVFRASRLSVDAM